MQILVVSFYYIYLYICTDMKVKMNIPMYPPTLEPQDIDKIAAWAHSEGNPLYPVPVVWTKHEFKQFLQKIFYEKNFQN